MSIDIVKIYHNNKCDHYYFDNFLKSLIILMEKNHICNYINGNRIDVENCISCSTMNKKN